MQQPAANSGHATRSAHRSNTAPDTLHATHTPLVSAAVRPGRPPWQQAAGTSRNGSGGRGREGGTADSPFWHACPLRRRIATCRQHGRWRTITAAIRPAALAACLVLLLPARRALLLLHGQHRVCNRTVALPGRCMGRGRRCCSGGGRLGLRIHVRCKSPGAHARGPAAGWGVGWGVRGRGCSRAGRAPASCAMQTPAECTRDPPRPAGSSHLIGSPGAPGGCCCGSWGCGPPQVC